MTQTTPDTSGRPPPGPPCHPGEGLRVRHNPHDPHDIDLGDLAILTADLLAREMDDIFLDLIHTSGTDPHSPQYGMAKAANRIVVRCRRLVQDIRRYQRYNNLRKQLEQEQPGKQEKETDIPF